jgi:hypothetical protein
VAQFGGWSQFGAHTKFGGARPLAERFYRVAKSILVPGFWPDDDDLTLNRVLRAECKLLAEGQVHADRLFAEIFPSSADECLPDWATLLGVVFPATATLAEKQDVVVARWRAQQGASLPELREMLYPLLRPSTAFWDDMDDGALSSRFELLGNGTRSETGTDSALTLLATVDGDWLAGNANRALYRLHDITDGFTWLADVTARTIGVATAAGIVLYGDEDNAVMLTLGDDGAAGVELRLDVVAAGVLTEDWGSVAIADPGVPEYLQLKRDKASGQITASYGTDPAALTALHTFALPIPTVRKVGWFVRNVTATKNAASISVDSVKLVHETPKNNVEIVEQRQYNVDLSGNDEQIFFAFVHRESSDAGAYNIAEAQRLLDKVAQGHTLILCGERDEFRCDDAESLCDRDIIGRY